MSVKNNINTDSGELSLLMCGASLFFTPFAGLTKEWTFVFLPWGGPQGDNPPPLVAACGLSCAEACCSICCSSSFSSNSSSTSLTSAPDSESFSATRISVMASSSSFSFLVAVPSAYKSDLLRLRCNCAQQQTHIMNIMGFFYGESKTDLKPRCDSCTILQLCGGGQVFLVNLRVCVANYCPTTPTECCSATRARQWDLPYL